MNINSKYNHLNLYYKWRYEQNKKMDLPKEDKVGTNEIVFYERFNLFEYCKSVGVYTEELKNWRKWGWIPGKRQGAYWVAPRIAFGKFLDAILYPPMPQGCKIKEKDFPLFREWHLANMKF